MKRNTVQEFSMVSSRAPGWTLIMVKEEAAADTTFDDAKHAAARILDIALVKS